jgi:hypothetical protein
MARSPRQAQSIKLQNFTYLDSEMNDLISEILQNPAQFRTKD